MLTGYWVLRIMEDGEEISWLIDDVYVVIENIIGKNYECSGFMRNLVAVAWNVQQFVQNLFIKLKCHPSSKKNVLCLQNTTWRTP